MKDKSTVMVIEEQIKNTVRAKINNKNGFMKKKEGTSEKEAHLT